MDFKYLFIDREYKPSGNFRYKKIWRKEPVNKDIFIKALDQITNFNLDNKDFITNFYKKYINAIFVDITSKSIDSYSKYFFRTQCLELESNSTRDKYWEKRGWSKEEMKIKRSEKYATGTVNFQIKNNHLSETDAIDKLNEVQTRIKQTRKNTYNIKSKENPNYWKEQNTACKEFYLKRNFSEEESIKLANIESNKQTESIKIFHQDNKGYMKDKTPVSKDFWIKYGYTEKESILKVREAQLERSFTLEKCIERYGEDTGTDRFIKRQDAWKKKVFNNKQWIGGGLSKVSNELFEILNAQINYKSLFGKTEKFIRTETLVYKYDFTIKDKKKIIEFNGDYWHCNPDTKFGIDGYFHKIKNMTSEEIWNYDKKKIKVAEKHGYRVKVIWEKDYRDDPDKVIKECLEFINND